MSSVERYALKDGSTRWVVRYRDLQGVQRKSKGHRTKRDAQLYAAKLDTEQATGRWVDPSKARGLTVDDLSKRWLAQVSGHLKATTLASREITYATHVRPQFGSVDAAKLKPSDVRAWVAAMRAAETGASTIAKAVLCLRQILQMAVEDSVLVANVAAGVKTPASDHVDKGYLSHQQLDALAIEAGEDHQTFVLFQGYCGLRFGESAALRVSDLDLLRRRVAVQRSVAEVAGKQVWSTPKTGERRTVPVPAFLCDLLARQVEGRDREAPVFGDGQHVLRVSTWRPRVFNPAAQRCRDADPEFPARLTPHSLRHTAASLAVASGASVLALSKMLGHSRPSITLDVYSGLFDQDLQAVAGALDAERARALGVPSTGGLDRLHMV